MTEEQTYPPRSRWPFRHRLSTLLVGGFVAALVLWGRLTPNSERVTQAAARNVDDSASAAIVTATTDAATTDAGAPANSEFRPATAELAAATPTEHKTPATADLHQKILGRWSDNFYGKRVFTFRDDGTAEMTIELDSVGKALYGPLLKFFIAWEIRGDVLHLQMTGGEPAGSAVTLAKIYGEKSERRIEKLSAEEMQLRSLDSNTLYIHRRVVESP